MDKHTERCFEIFKLTLCCRNSSKSMYSVYYHTLSKKNVRQLPKISDVEINIVGFFLKNGTDNTERTLVHLVYFYINEYYIKYTTL